MDRNDRQAIEQLFGKLAAVERQYPERDSEAEAFIRDRIAEQSGAPYYMAQTIIMQEQALQAAQAQIDALEARAAQRPAGGLFGGLFGNSGASPRRAGSVPSVSRAPSAATHSGPQQQQPRSGGFLAGAAQTAMGVAGGVLLGNAIAGMFDSGTGEANAAEAGTPADEVSADEGGTGFDDGGFDMDF